MKLDKLTLGHKFGKALFELAQESQQTDQVLAELTVIDQLFLQNSRLMSFLNNSQIPLERRTQLLTLITDELSQLSTKLINVLFSANRLADFSYVFQGFAKFFWREKRVAQGTVTTAVEISKEQQGQLEKEIAEKFNLEQVQLTNVIDPQIIGGVIVEVNQKIIDGSIRHQFNKLEQLLKS
jgi:F-type H+-transporting ATPase subunit delta